MATETTAAEKLELANIRADELRSVIGTKVGSGETFDVESVELAAIVASSRELLKSVNARALDEETSQISAALEALIAASKLADLMGQPVTSLFWSKTPGEGENGPVINCAINVKARVPAVRTTGNGGGRGGSRKTPSFKVDGGDTMTALEFVVAHAPEAVQEYSLFKEVDGKRKWPTKPSHLDETEKAMVEAGHTVERIVPDA